MFKIKQYINNNKQLLIRFLGMLVFLFIHNLAYCNPMFLLTLFPNLPEKLLDKAIDFTPYLFNKVASFTPYAVQGAGWTAVGTTAVIGGVKLCEFGYNWRYIGTNATNNIPLIGPVIEWSGSFMCWGYEKLTGTKIEPVQYTYFFPKIASVLGDPKFFTKKIIFDLSNQKVKVTTDKDMVREVEVVKYDFIDRVEKQIEYRDRPVYERVTEFVDKPVYVPVVEYRDRENLLVLGEKTDKLTFVTNESNLSHIGLHNGYAQLKEEILQLIESNKKKSLNLTKIAFYSEEETLGIRYEYSNGPYVSIAKANFPYPFLLTMFETFAEYNQTKYGFFRPEEQETMYNCPTIELSYSNATLFNSPQLQLDKTMVTRIFCQDNMLLFDQGVNFFMTNNVHLQRIQTEQQQLVCELRQKINDGLLSKETTDQGTQTMDFSINGMFFDEINSYLKVQDQTSFIVASQDGQNLPFNELNASNTRAGIEMMKKYKEAKMAKKQALKEQEISIQTEPRIHEGVNTVNSNLFQNMATLFSVVLVSSLACDSHTVELIAKSLLGFTHIPEYNQVFLAATHMSVGDLQLEYSFSLDEARRAYDAIGQAYDIRHPGSSLSDISSNLSNSNDYLDQAQKMSNSWGWKDYLLFTGGIVIACGTLYYVYQSVKTGAPVENIQNISPNVEVWKNAYFDKINKL